MKIVITGGCSFSECISPWIETWPRHLERQINSDVAFHEGLGCQGNDNISRQIIHRVSETLKNYSNEDILVGIMWSGFDRKSLFVNYQNLEKINHGMTIPGQFGESLGVYNPYNWIEESSSQGWLILGGDDRRSKAWFTELHHAVEAQLTTIEHILRVQWFLKLNNIKYFMTTYMSEVLDEFLTNNYNVKHLYNQIDFNNFLPVVGEYEWCRDFSGLDFPIPGDKHPSTEQHKLFSEQIIIPFLKEKNYI